MGIWEGVRAEVKQGPQVPKKTLERQPEVGGKLKSLPWAGFRGHLEGLRIGHRELCLVIQHLLKVGDVPLAVRGVAVETLCQARRGVEANPSLCLPLLCLQLPP